MGRRSLDTVLFARLVLAPQQAHKAFDRSSLCAATTGGVPVAQPDQTGWEPPNNKTHSRVPDKHGLQAKNRFTVKEIVQQDAVMRIC
jgi:hypothetical protein